MEMARLLEFHALAKSIVKNSKGQVLLTALRRGFDAATEARKDQVATLQQKAVIFTESRRTQDYLFGILEQTEFAGKVMVFNGTNTDPKSKDIYRRWLEKHAGTDRISGSPSSDKRAALVEHFRDEAAIMIATEAAAEGINLQFCNLVVNYDLPWNPQRIEQRIGRCHRYGQKFDVVVANFLNKKNAADKRVYELLDQKFRLFDGVFGASDEVLGAVESGVDFEKRIASIYQQCRTPEQIEFEFDQLQSELEAQIAEGHRDAREKLLDNFDQEVVEKVRIQSHDFLDRFNERLWLLTQYLLAPYARFEENHHSFVLDRNPFPDHTIRTGRYRMGKNVEEANTYRVGHPLARRLLDQAMNLPTPSAEVLFDYSGSTKNIAVLESLGGDSGWISCLLVSISALETVDHIIFCGITDKGEVLEDVQCRRLFDLPGSVNGPVRVPQSVEKSLSEMAAQLQQLMLDDIAKRDGHWFDTEMDKLDHWAEDQRNSLKAVLDALDQQIKESRKSARQAPNLPEKLKYQRELRNLEEKRNEAWKEYDAASHEIDRQKDKLLDEISQRLEQEAEQEILFTLRWYLM